MLADSRGERQHGRGHKKACRAAQRVGTCDDYVVDGAAGDVRGCTALGPTDAQLLLGLFANYVLVPAVTFGLLCVFQANPMVSVGFFILAACPGAPVGPPITAIAKGDVPWSIGMMLILAVLSAILSPALLSVLLAPDSARQQLAHQLFGYRTDLVDNAITALGDRIGHPPGGAQVEPSDRHTG